ncbi:MAG: hypothetical protein PUJ55_10630 [Clostridiales bacterium]|nr:hypothetical protein [Roseburia sp.]MDD7637376.1 hypothetical protein [Clostridiales bacterium]MDY4113882.1 hypothetical protein [Roseburia sp.]
MIGTNELRIAVEVLKYYNENSRLFGFDNDELDALAKTEKIMKRELNWQDDQEAHSEVTIEMELGREISLAEWARIHKIDESTARQKARRGGFKTARKVGRDWLIMETEENPDGRRKK